METIQPAFDDCAPGEPCACRGDDFLMKRGDWLVFPNDESIRLKRVQARLEGRVYCFTKNVTLKEGLLEGFLKSGAEVIRRSVTLDDDAFEDYIRLRAQASRREGDPPIDLEEVLAFNEEGGYESHRVEDLKDSFHAGFEAGYTAALRVTLEAARKEEELNNETANRTKGAIVS